MATTAPVVAGAACATARARQAATIPEICSAFPAVIERRPKILRLEDKSDPFLSASNAWAAIVEGESVLHTVLLLFPQPGWSSAVKRQLVHVTTRISRSPVILDQWSLSGSYDL